MSTPGLCPHCLKPLGPVALPVCPHCARRLPEPGAPTADAEATEVPLPRIDSPLIYGASAGRYVLEVATAAILPGLAFVLPSVAPDRPELVGLWIGLGAVVAVGVAVVRHPGWSRLVIDTRGLRRRGRLVPWARVTGVHRVAPPGRAQVEPLALEIRVADEKPLRLTREQAARGTISSLRNLAEMLEARLAERDAPAGVEPDRHESERAD